MLISEHNAARHGLSDLHAIAATLAPLVGYKAFLIAACFALLLMCTARSGVLPMSSAQLRECVALTSDAVELFMLPRIAEAERALAEEGGFCESVQSLVAAPQMLAPYGAAGVRLLASWRRLAQSGVLQRRQIGVARQHAVHRRELLHAAPPPRPPLRPGCAPARWRRAARARRTRRTSSRAPPAACRRTAARRTRRWTGPATRRPAMRRLRRLLQRHSRREAAVRSGPPPAFTARPRP
jgi:hypothetical protein